MSKLRKRSRRNFPTVLLTLISMIQAVALENLWQKARSNAEGWSFDLAAGIDLLQLGLSLTALILMWVFYVHLVMRFKFLPTTRDAIVPFFLGLLEFLVIELAEFDRLGYWLLALSVSFWATQFIIQSTMRRARQDPANAEFFAVVGPLSVRDMLFSRLRIASLAALGLWWCITPPPDINAFAALLIITPVVLYQFRLINRFWRVGAVLDHSPRAASVLEVEGADQGK